MRRVIHDRFGEPDQVLRVVDAADPAPGEGEVTVRMRARPINPADLLRVRGRYGTQPALPAVPGFEGLGTVAALGPGVTGVAVGARVVPRGGDGTWQGIVRCQARNLLAVPDGVSDLAGAQFVVNPMTALAMVDDVLAVQPGEWLVQTAAGSTLGRIVLQLAKLKGFRTINLVRRAAQAAELKALGADVVIATEAGNVAEAIRAAAGKEPATKAIEAVGGETGGAVFSALGQGGTLVSYGLLSGAPIPVDVGGLVFQGKTLRGFWLSEWFRLADRTRRAALTAELARLMTEGLVAPPVEASYALEDVVDAVRHAERPGRKGKVLLVD